MTGATLKGKDKVQPTNKHTILRYESISGKKICCLKKRGSSSLPTPTWGYGEMVDTEYSKHSA